MPLETQGKRGEVLKVAAAVAVGIIFLAALVVYQVISAHRATTCGQRLRNAVVLYVALMCYTDDHGRLPPPHAANRDGGAVQSWRVLLLPHLSQESLYSRINHDEPWDSPANRQLWGAMPEYYWSPAKAEATGTTTSYVAVLGPHATWWGPEGTIPWKAPNRDAVMLIELVDSKIPWMEPRDATVEELLEILRPQDEEDAGNNRPLDFCYLTVIGDVRIVDPNISREGLRRLLLGEGGNDKEGGQGHP